MIDLPEGSYTLTSEQIQHLHFLLQPYYMPLDYEGECPAWMNADFYSYILFAYLNPTDTEKPWHGYGGYCKSDDSDDGFLRFYEPLPEVNLYCCPNGFRSWNSRKKEKLIALQNLVIDLDAHNCDLSVSDLQDHIKEVVPLIVDKLILQPNFVSYTGRGVHLWYCIEPCSCALVGTVEKVAEGLTLHCKSVLSELCESILDVDEGTSKKLSGLIRVPYTYNLKSCTWGEGQLLHYNRPHVDALYHALDEINCIDRSKPKVEMKKYKAAQKKQRKKAKKEKRKKPGMKYAKAGLYRGAFIHRKAFVEHLIETRENITGNCRELLLFALTHAVYNLTDDFEDCKAYIHAVNSGFDDPLPDNEVEATLKGVYNHNYKYTNKKFLELVKATPEEIKYFNRGKKRSEQLAAHLKKMNRDEKILSLWDSGESVTSIARTVGCARNTVYAVIRQPLLEF